MGMSTFGTFTMARLGIYVSQQALNVTGNNISNINTEGYSRQALDQKAMSFGGADRYISQLVVRENGGVLATGVNQLRDQYLDIRYRNEMTKVGEMEAKLDGLNQLADIFDEVGKAEGDGVLEARFNDLIQQLENLSQPTNVGDDGSDGLVQKSAEQLAIQFNDYAKQLETLEENIKVQFHDEVEGVNTILTKIRDLNTSIRQSEIFGNDALTQRDERNLLIDKLSEKVGINVTIETERLDDGREIEKLVINTAGDPNSYTLIDGIYGAQLSIKQVDSGDAVMVDSPNFDLTVSELTSAKGKLLEGSEAKDIGDTELSGALQAMRELLTEEGEYADAFDLLKDPDAGTKRGIPYYRQALDTLARTFAKAMNEANDRSALVYKTADYDRVGYKDAQGNIFTEKELQDSSITDLTPYTKVYITPDKKETTDPNRYKIYVDEKGDEIPLAMDKGGKPLLLDGAAYQDPSLFIKKDEYSYYNGGALFTNKGDSSGTTDNITAANISVAYGWSHGMTRVLRSTEPQAVLQSTKQDNITHIIHLLTSDQTFTFGTASEGTTKFTGTFQEMLTDTIAGTLAKDQSITESMLNNYNATADELYINRDAVMGVDLNDEAMNMMMFQKAYSAACRLMTTFDSLLDKLINGTAI